MQRLTGIAAAFFFASGVTALAETAATPVAVGAQLSQDANGAELSFDLSQPVASRVYAMASPERIVVELPAINFQLDPSLGRLDAGNAAPIVKAFRFGLLSPRASRIVIDLARSACPGRVESKPIVDGASASRLKIELKRCDETAFAALDRPPDAIDAPAALLPAAQPVIVLDPGHGGTDGGAKGVEGALEKNLVFAFCVELKRQLESTKRYTVVMTRDGDQYVGLDERVDIARKANASLFVSIHADTLSQDAEVNGATVYTVADRASDAEAARIAAHENAVDQGKGNEKRAQQDPGVADILFDLKRRETRLYAHMFSRGLLASLRPATRLNRNPARAAGFVVLRAPEFPSVLVELGYLSNRKDVQSLSSPEWRAKSASAMVSAIDAFFGASAGATPGLAADTGVALDGRPTKVLAH